MATLWQPYGNLMATLWQPYDLAWKNLALRRYKNDFEYSGQTLGRNQKQCLPLPWIKFDIFQRLFRLSANTSGLLQDIQTKQCLPLHFFPKDWIVGTDLVLDVHSIKNRLPVKVGGFCTFEWSALKKHS